MVRRGSIGVGFVVVAGLWGQAVWAENTLIKRDDLSRKDLLRVRAVTKLTTDFSKPETYEQMSAGKTTTLKRIDRTIFSQASANLTFEEESRFKLGNALFKKLWVSSPASTKASDGLGPLYNARSCRRCHVRDGRGHPPENADDTNISMFLRLSIKPQTDAQRAALKARRIQVVPEPTYGRQLQEFGVQGVAGEGRMRITYKDVPVTFADGTVVTLRKPSYSVVLAGYGPMHKDVLLSPRVAQPMQGLGLLEAIHVADILKAADPDDKDGDGISGKPSWVLDKAGRKQLGRFGWKASTATVLQQSADAFAGDIGLSSPIANRPFGDCTDNQTLCKQAPTGVQPWLGDTELPDPIMALVEYYTRNLAVPARRNVGKPDVLAGKKLFYTSGCVSCHRPKYVTRRDADLKEHRFQLIWPYTDMLLHDMGPGLADNRPVGDATGREWRTAPLWGIGLTKTVSGHTYFLHDGRARSLTEAILWHGGEGEASKQSFLVMTRQERDALISFLESL